MRRGVASMDAYQHGEHLVQRFHGVDSSVVVAGHYCLAEAMQDLSHDGVEEVSSFQLGAKLVAATLDSGGQSRLILWVNDIGIAPARPTSNTIRIPTVLPISLPVFLRLPPSWAWCA